MYFFCVRKFMKLFKSLLIAPAALGLLAPMSANSNEKVPTQKAVVSYIGNRVSGGGAYLNVSGFRAGQVKVRNAEIFNEAFPTNGTITFPQTTELAGGIDGYLMALNYFTGGVASTELNEGDPISATDPSNGYGQ